MRAFGSHPAPWVILICILALASAGLRAQAADDDLRERMTEREDKRRPAEPWSADVAGRPLTLSGEYEFEPSYLRRRVVGIPVSEPDRFLLEQQLEVEAFYSFGLPLSAFAQLRLRMEEDLLPDTFEETSDLFVERGEMWLRSERMAGSHLHADVGRLHFEDDRRWWWDDDLDAIRIEYETETLDLALALARELYPNRSDRHYIDPVQDRLPRLIAEATWDWSPNHDFSLFVLHQDDRSPSERPGEVVLVERQDESDARLTWVGARLLGVFGLRSRGLLGYWLDTALVRGEERLTEFEPISPKRGVVESRTRTDVSGWAADAGINWILPLAWEPRLFAGYAIGSGGSTPDGGTDRSFRQTGIQANEAGFGGVERFAHYGVLLDPELSNLGILTLGAGLSLLRSSSLDLVYHHYRLVELATSLRDARLEVELAGTQHDLGDEIDLVLALEEWERLEFEFVAAAFSMGAAFATEEDTWSYGGSFAVRFAF